jgi:hypothetical protein
MQSGSLCCIWLIYKVNHLDFALFIYYVYVRCWARRNLHANYFRTQIYLLYNLMKLKISNKYAIALSNITKVWSKIVIQKTGLHLILRISFIEYKSSLCCVVVVIECIYTFCFSETIVYILLNIEAIHEYEGRRLRFVKKFLFKAVAILSIVDKNFTVCCWN